MARKVYFSFHYKDVQDGRANIVRNSSVFGKKRDLFRDASIKEEAEEKKVKTLRKLIDDELDGTSVTCVLIGSETFSRRWVRYEIVKSFVMKKGILGVGINWVKDLRGETKFLPGENPFRYLRVRVAADGSQLSFEEYKSDWVSYRDLPTCKNKHFDTADYGRTFVFSKFYDVYSYDWNNGKKNLNEWIERSAKRAGR